MGSVLPRKPATATAGASAESFDGGVLAGSKPASAKSSENKPSKAKPGKTHWWERHPRILIAAIIVLLAVGGGVAWALTHTAKKPAPVHRAVKPKPVPPAPIYSPLTGIQVKTQAEAQQPVIGVMIENLYPNAWPQSGLGQAGVVYEALAEGGITRFLAIFQTLPASIGPVRSLRPYYLDWGLEYGIPVAHAGGSQPALAAIKPLGLKDINALVYSGSYFYRTNDRAAPHNLYTNANLLATLDSKLGFATPPTFTPLPRKADKVQSPATHPKITIPFSGGHYVAQYNFDATADAYSRVMGGIPHVDRNTNQQIVVKNVVVEFVPTSYSTQPDGKPQTNMQLIGSGQALVFNDGSVTAATWSKTSDAAQTTLTDSAGKAVIFNRGVTWYEIVPVGNAVTY